MPDCVFCDITRGQSPARMFYQDEFVSAFQSNLPAARVHVLVIPNKHVDSVNEFEEADAELIGKMVLTARKLARELGIAESGYRLVINTGPDARQSVFHVHLHLMGGERLFVRPFQSQPGL